MNDIIGTAGTGATADEALEAYTAFRHSMDEQTPLNKAQAGRIDKIINNSARCRDGFLFIVVDPAIEDSDLAAYITENDVRVRASSIAYRALYSPVRTIPAGRVTQAVALLDTVAATNPNTQTNVLALQATLLWLDGRNGQAQERAGRALQDDPWNRMAQLMLKATSNEVSPRWVH